MSLARTVVVLRHGKAGDRATSDHDRRLTPDGAADARRVGEWLAGAGLAAPLVAYVSSAARTVGTWEQVAPGLDGLDPEVEVRDDLYLATGDAVREVVAATDDEVATVVVVGHNPTATDLALGWSEGATGADRERLERRGVPTAGCVVVDLDRWGDDSGELRSFVVPRDL